MQPVLSFWNALGTRRQIVAAVAAIAMFAAVLGIARMAAAPGMALLYSGLEGAAAGEVIQALDQRGIRYQVQGEAIYVDASRRDQTRMLLASEGMPAMSAAGYELLDSLSGFGTTAQMFDAAYWRAREGELARTIVSSPHILTARVHIANPVTQPFRRDMAPTASVAVSTRSGTLSPQQAMALRFLVAAAVPGLRPDAVAVIDGNGAMVAVSEDRSGGASGNERAAELRRNVERLLAARVGVGRAVVEVNVETITESETIRERRFDPDGRVAIATETEERTRTASGGQAPGVTVASNLPAGEAGAEAARSESRDTESRTRTNFEVTETQREVQRTPGAIRRITVAVLVDGRRDVGPDGSPAWSPRPQEEMDALRELVASAVGFDAERGDVVTLHSMSFDLPEVAEAGPETGFMGGFHLDPMSLIQLAVLAFVALVLGLFVIRPLLRPAPARTMGLPAPAGTARRDGLPAPSSVTSQDGAAEIGGRQTLAPMRPGESQGLSSPARELSGDRHQEAVDRLRQLIAERQDETVEILRNWMEDREEQA